MRKMTLSFVIIVIIITGCNQNASDQEVDEPANLEGNQVNDEGENRAKAFNSMNKKSQRDFGWHKNRLNSSRTGKFKDKPQHENPNALLQQAETINAEGDQDQALEYATEVKRKLEKLDTVFNAYVVELNGRLYIGLESEDRNERIMDLAIKEIVEEKRSDLEYSWFTDREAVNRIRAAERVQHPNQEQHIDDWFKDVEYEIQKRGNGWLG